MLCIKTSTISQAWREIMKDLHSNGQIIENDKIFRDEAVALEVENTTEDLFDSHFPMPKDEVEIINHYLITGEKENQVTHDWTKIYRKRLFNSESNQIKNIIEYLKKKPRGKRAQASIWKQEVDLTGPIAPCLQLLWFQVVNSKLSIHVHMRASDCYGKLLMNMNEFATLQHYVAKEISVAPGKYIHFIDTCHFNTPDRENIEKIIKEI